MNKKRIVTSAVALGVAAAIGLGGTFAWQSINQTALNEASDIVNPGGRLHNDQWFVDSKTNNNDIYVENFTDKENGEDIYARVRLSEYMEIVMNYGIKDAEVVETVAGSKTPVVDEDGNQVDADLSADDATRKNQFTYEYETHYFNKENATDKYWNWELGEKDSERPYFIPTFNMNKDSLLADLNGDYVDTLGGISNRKNEQYKYEEITSESSKTAYEVYDGDTNKLDEVTRADLLDLIENGTGAEHYDTYKDNIVLSEDKVEHKAKQVGTTNGLISMSDWAKLNDGTYSEATHGNYWVYDDSEDGDGWVYWSSPIKAGTTTGLLLDSTNLKQVMDDTWYYAIQVTAQFVTADDMGTPGEGEDGVGATGFYKDGETVSDAAKDFLEEIGVDVDGTGKSDEDDEDDENLTTLTLGSKTSFPFVTITKGERVKLVDGDGKPATVTQVVEWDYQRIHGMTEKEYTLSQNGVLTIGDGCAANGGLFYIEASGDLFGYILVDPDDTLTMTTYQGENTKTDAAVVEYGKAIQLAVSGKTLTAERITLTPVVETQGAADSFTLSEDGKLTVAPGGETNRLYYVVFDDGSTPDAADGHKGYCGILLVTPAESGGDDGDNGDNGDVEDTTPVLTLRDKSDLPKAALAAYTPAGMGSDALEGIKILDKNGDPVPEDELILTVKSDRTTVGDAVRGEDYTYEDGVLKISIWAMESYSFAEVKYGDQVGVILEQDSCYAPMSVLHNGDTAIEYLAATVVTVGTEFNIISATENISIVPVQALGETVAANADTAIEQEGNYTFTAENKSTYYDLDVTFTNAAYAGQLLKCCALDDEGNVVNGALIFVAPTTGDDSSSGGGTNS